MFFINICYTFCMELKYKSISITLPGDTPSKKNSKRVFVRGKRPVVLSSKRHEYWHTTLCKTLVSVPRLDIQLTELVTINFYFATKRISDISNKAESIMDILVDLGVLHDDNHIIVPNLNISFCGYDKDNPRAEVVIHY